MLYSQPERQQVPPPIATRLKKYPGPRARDDAAFAFTTAIAHGQESVHRKFVAAISCFN
jgi:hypothetical protein